MKSIPVLVVLIASVVSVGANDALAALGGTPMTPPATDEAATVRVLQRAANATARPSDGTAAVGGFTVRETTLGSGTVIREYLNSAGTVFAVAWQGPVKPNLLDLLGNYFPQYIAGVQASRAARGVRAPVVIDGDTLVVHAGGHDGSFSGQAWLPAALPAGVTGRAIQ
ncbi:DUF2844 domain-containing protein [Burkholderia cepacia]|uniref:DUF2844 domain-containing protein n=1 Tax=Burkholderia cepacia TaxID=292 RepID=UPI0017820F6C